MDILCTLNQTHFVINSSECEVSIACVRVRKSYIAF